MPVATGGSIAWSGATEVHTFSASGYLVPSVAIAGTALVVGGGGGGGGAGGGGGGAGAGVASSFAVSAGNYSVQVGVGGAGGTNTGNGADGGTSLFRNITAAGGGQGAGFYSGAIACVADVCGVCV